MRLPILIGRYRHRAAGRRRQIGLYEENELEGHRRQAAIHGRAMRVLRRLIGSLVRFRPLSAAGAAFIQRHEGFVPTPYPDPAGYATVGTGHLIRHGPVRAADHVATWIRGQETPGRLTPAEGRRLLRVDVREDLEPAVRALFEKGGPLYGQFTQARADALFSFGYNLGAGALQGAVGFETMWRALQAGDIRAIGDAMLLYDKAGGQALPGLIRRRREERRLFLRGKYQ